MQVGQCRSTLCQVDCHVLMFTSKEKDANASSSMSNKL